MIRLGIIGVGGMGTAHVKQFAAQPRAKVTAIADQGHADLTR